MTCFAFPVIAQTPTTPKDGPKIEFATKEHNFGTIKRNSIAEYRFEFVNTGNKPLNIKNVRSSCGCTTPELSQEKIMPGESAYVKVRYNTGIIGGFNKTVTVSSDAVDNPRVVLHIKGYVIKTFDIEKRNGKWGIVDMNDKVIVPFEYDTIIQADMNGYIVAQKNSKFGVIDEQNKIIIPFLYSKIHLYGKTNRLVFDEEGYLQAQRNGKWGIVDINNKIIIPFEYDDVFCPGDSRAVTYFDFRRSFSADNGHTCAVKNGKIVVLNKNKQIVKSY